MYNQFKFLIKLSILLVLSAVMVISTAHAWDQKGYSGNFCDAYFASSAGQINDYWNGAHNSGTTAAWVSCPVMRDNHTETDGPSGYTWVRVYDSTQTDSVRCTLNSTNNIAATPSIIANASDASSVAGVGHDWLGLRIPTAVGNSQIWGSYTMWCWLPPGSRIVYYNVYEATPTDSNN